MYVDFYVKKEYVPGREVRELSDIHLQNARRYSFNKVSALTLESITLDFKKRPYPLKLRSDLAFYKKMFEYCDSEFFRRYMQKDLVYIDEKRALTVEELRRLQKTKAKENEKTHSIDPEWLPY